MIGYINWTPEELKAEAMKRNSKPKAYLGEILLHDNGKVIGATFRNARLTDADRAVIIKHYERFTRKGLAHFCGCTVKAVSNFLNKNGLTQVSEPEAVKKYRKIVRHSLTYNSTISYSGKLLKRCRCGRGFLTDDVKRRSCTHSKELVQHVSKNGIELVL